MALPDRYCFGDFKVIEDHPEFWLIELRKPHARSRTEHCQSLSNENSLSKKRKVATNLSCESDDVDPEDFLGEDEARAHVELASDPRDKIAFKMVDRKSDLQMYDKDGNTFDSLLPHTATAVIALPNGTVISPHHKAEFLFFYTDEDDIEKIAPGAIIEFSPECDALVRWAQRDHQSEDENSHLPIHTILTATRTVSLKTREKLALQYFAHLNASDKPSMLRTSRSLRHDEFADLYDYLEFFHIRRQFIFRTALGEYIFKQFIEPFKNFGLETDKHCYNLISKTWNGGCVGPVSPSFSTCQACNLLRTVTWDFAGFQVGSECKERLQYFSVLNSLLRGFLSAEYFDMEAATMLMRTLRSEAGKFQKKLAEIALRYKAND
jgi:hypothetical protein